MRRDPENIRKKFILSLVALVGLISLIFGLFEYQNAQKSLSWPTVTGRVYESRIVRNDDNHDPSYKAVIRYNYMVNHRVYKSSRVHFGSSFMLSSPEYPEELIHKFPFNSEPTVYYQQNDPNQAVLVPGVNKSVYNIILIGSGLFLFSIGAIVYLFKRDHV